MGSDEDKGMTPEAQQQRAASAADVLDRIAAGLIELNGQLQDAHDDPKGQRVVLDHLNKFVEATLPELTDLSMQIRPTRIVRPGEE
jgi:hypothetical protein